MGNSSPHLLAGIFIDNLENEIHNNQVCCTVFGVGLVRFANSPCTANSNLIGTCYRRRQCTDIDGSPAGNCANGIGACCVILRTCGETSSYNSTYFTNAAYPTPVTGSTRCTMTIQRCNPDICQVRIDFLNFNLAQPNAMGVCNSDALFVTGGGGSVPVICGENTGQHIYVDFNGNDTINLIITTSATGPSLGRVWNFLVTQIACACPTRAPSGCLQFFNTTTGTVSSFNYGVGSNVIDPTTGLPGTRQLVNENYGICVGMLPASSKPFVLTVVTNGDEVNDVANTGFSLSFMQLPCANNMFLG
nr:uncharacterized protein LOC111504952 [Leptinotarsa decemlineata]